MKQKWKDSEAEIIVSVSVQEHSYEHQIYSNEWFITYILSKFTNGTRYDINQWCMLLNVFDGYDL